MAEIRCMVCGAVCPDGDEWFQDDWQRFHRQICPYKPGEALIALLKLREAVFD